MYVSFHLVARGPCQHPVSANLTIERSPGLVRPGEGDHGAIPAESRKPPAPIDPSSTCLHLLPADSTLTSSGSLQVVPHLRRAGLELCGSNCERVLVLVKDEFDHLFSLRETLYMHAADLYAKAQIVAYSCAEGLCTNARA